MSLLRVSVKLFFLSFLLCLTSLHLPAQDQRIADSLHQVYLQNDLTDSSRFVLLEEMCFNEVRDLDKAVAYANEMKALAEKIGSKKYLRRAWYSLGTKERLRSHMKAALNAFFKSAEIAKELKNLLAEGESYLAVADMYSNASNHNTSTGYYKKAIAVLRQSEDSTSLASALLNLGDEMRKAKKYDSAVLYTIQAKQMFESLDNATGKAYGLGNLGMIYAATGKKEQAKKSLDEAILILAQHEDYNAVCDYLLSMADLYRDRGQMPTAIQYAATSLQYSQQYGIREQAVNASLKLSTLYEQTGNSKEAFRFYKQHVALRDSINNIQTVQQMADLRTNYEVSQKQSEVDLASQKEKDQKKVSLLLAGILGMALIISAILIVNIRHRKRAYGILNLQKQATEEQRTKAEHALDELQAAQKQLIYSAKMASLGEVTAGIAHEIQNPLNFVNNFSEVSMELMEELKETVLNKLSEADRSNMEILTKDLANNLQRINDHGKRADSIVKSMLQHSRGSTGQKEFVDLNAQVEESLKLSYHGARAKDKTFIANTATEFDQQIGQIKLVPQDISRSLLNLFNNALYAVNQQNKKALPGFKPLVQVITKRKIDKITITIRDNGTGIPIGIIDKIFQPFFTTKPTGEGTGLGLSLTYEIIKANDGELKVTSEEGKFTEFVIELPLLA